MVERKEGSAARRRRVAQAALIVAFAGVVLFYFGQACCRNVAETLRLRERERQLVIEQQKNDAVKRRIEELKTDEGIEKEARRSLGMTSPGEVGYRVIEKKTPVGDAGKGSRNGKAGQAKAEEGKTNER